MAFILSIMFSCSMFFSIVKTMPVFDGRDDFLENYQLNNCSFISNITVPTFDPTSKEDDDPMSKLMKPLSNCKQHVSVGDHDFLCQEVYEIILSLSRCNNSFSSQFGTFHGFIDVKLHSDVCLGFRKSGMMFRKTENFVSPVLRDRSICELMCKGKYEAVCKVLLWAKEVYSQLIDYFKVYPLARFLEVMKEDNCTFSKSFVAPDFHDDNKNNDLVTIIMVHSKPCNDVITFDKPEAILCTALFHSLLTLSTCNGDILDNEEIKIEKEIHSDICKAFEESENSLTVGDNDIITYLQSHLVCDGICSGSTKSICQIILWAYEIEQELTVHPVVSKRLGAVPKEELKSSVTMKSEIFDITMKLKEEVAKALGGSPTIKKKIPYSNFKVPNTSDNGYDHKVSDVKLKKDHGISKQIDENKDIYQKTQFRDDMSVSEIKKSKVIHENISNSELKENYKSVTFNKIDKTQSFLTSTVDSSTVKKQMSAVKPELHDTTEKAIESSKTEQEIQISTVASQYIEKTVSQPTDLITDSKKKVELVIPTMKPFSTSLTDQTTKILPVNTASIASVTSERIGNVHQENDVTFITAFNTVNPLTPKESSELDNPAAYDVPYEGNDQKAYEDDDQKVSEDNGQKVSEDNDQKVSEDNDQKVSEDNDQKVSEDNDQKVSEDNDQKVSEDNDQKVPKDNDQKVPEDNDQKVSDYNDPKVSEDNDQKTLEPAYKELEKPVQDPFIEKNNSHFFLYFLCIVALITGCYLLIHNKQKVIALIVEGGRHKRRRRPHSASYKKLDS